MYANKFIAVLLALTSYEVVAETGGKVAQQAPVPTIGQLADQARMKRLADDSASKMMGQAGGVSNGSVPAGMSISVPSTQIIGDSALATQKAADEKKKAGKKKDVTPPEYIPGILGVYIKGAKRSVELVEINGSARFFEGQVTPSGWSITLISARSIELAKIDAKTGVQKRITLQVSGT